MAHDMAISRSTEFPLPMLDWKRDCLLLDFDGTLVEIVTRPEAVKIDAATVGALAVLYRRLQGAIAIVTGRSIGDIDWFLRPLVLPVAGVHGLTRRRATGDLISAPVDAIEVDRMARAIGTLVDANPGLILEVKWGAIALHYRRRPELAGRCRDRMSELAATSPAKVNLIDGKMVVEAKFAGLDKGAAIRAYMTETPFRDRRPIFAGDDLTDEDGFAAVHNLDGVTAKVGSNVPSIAQRRFNSTRHFLTWLNANAQLAREGDSDA